jgi:hypothetical protein
MGFIRRGFYFFTPYTDARERVVERFFKSLTERSNRSRTRARLGDLLQHDAAVINVWTEYRYKGYKYLRKSQRRKLYSNLQLIADDFDRFYATTTRSADAVVSHIHKLAPQATVHPERAMRLQALMSYFSPGRGIYKYRESSSFGRLLRDPSHQKLVGDCNQIATLYIYLYSRYYDVRDLQIRLLPEHVALHYNGIDIEATNGTFMNYGTQKGGMLLPIEEIVSINLLDTTDSYLSTHEATAEDLLQASRFAFILSHERGIVTRNLNVAYGRLINLLMRRNNYNQALKFAAASRDMSLLGIVGHNGAVYETERHDYVAARRFARYAPKRDTLIRDSWRSEGVDHYQAHRYHDAIKAFKHIDDRVLIRQCYEALFFKEQERLGSDMSIELIRRHAKIIKRMRTYAKKSGDKRLIKYMSNLHKHL